MRGRIGVVIGALAIGVALASPAMSQTPVAQIAGSVTDETGGVLPGVEVTVTQTSTGMTRFVITGTNGDYVVNNLPIGPYTLTATLSGFASFQQSGILLSIGDTRTINVVLRVGGVTESVHVQADANLVETRSVAVGTLVTQELMVGLPLNGRDPTQLILLAGGAVASTMGGFQQRVPGSAPVQIGVAGGLGNSTLYLVDGGYNNDPQVNTGNPLPFPDALQEFRTEAGVRDARSGMSSGATVNAVTKSGTNEFHGNAFEFLRHHRFNAIRYFEKTENGGLGREDGLRRHQFGGTLGGPVMRDKLFFFFGVQATENYVEPLGSSATVPTADVLRGDFRRIMSSACRTPARTLGPPFVNNQVDPALFHPISLKIVSMVPVADPANDPDGCGRYLYQSPRDTSDQQYVSRIDFQLTQSQRVFFRDFFFKSLLPSNWNADRPSLLDQTNSGQGLRTSQHTVAAGYDHVLAPTLFSSTRFSFQYTESLRFLNPGVPTWRALGVNTYDYTQSVPGQSRLEGGLWGGALTGTFYVWTPSFSHDFDWIVGSHSLSFGVSYVRPHSLGDGTIRSSTIFTFNGLYTSLTGQASGGSNMADFLLGHPQNVQESMSQLNDVVVHSPALYFNDTWRVNNRLTLNYGLRWEPMFALRDQNGFNQAFRRDRFEQGLRSQVYPNAPPGMVFKGDDDFPDTGANSSDVLLQFAPRVGVVWNPSADNRQTIRAGAGLYFDAPKTWTNSIYPIQAPWGNTTNAIHPGDPQATVPCPPGWPVVNRSCPLDYVNPWSATPGGEPLAGFSLMGEKRILPGPEVEFPLNSSFYSYPRDLKNTRVYQFNASYQRQVANRTLVEVTYTGNITRNIMVTAPQNAVVYVPGNCQAGEYALTAPGPCSNTSTANRDARRLLRLVDPVWGPYFGGNLTQVWDGASGHYNGVKFTLNKRMGDGWSLSTNYTISKCVNEGEPSQNNGSSFPVLYKDPFTDPVPDAHSAYGRCSTDRRHLFNLSSVILSPGLPVGGRVVNVLTKDWQVGLIVSVRSGSPITVDQSEDNNLTNGIQYGVRVPGVDPYLPESQRVWETDANGFRTRLPWYNLDAFTTNTIGTYGDTRNYLTGPSFWNADLAFSRIVRLRASQTVELRVEAFNLFNTVNWDNPSVEVGSTSLDNGKVTDQAGDPRIMQFAVKFGF
jgi:hypothetical protein